MSSTPHSAIDFSFRSYAEIGAPNRHDFVQLVLPLHGQLLLDIDGRPGKVDTQLGVVIPANTWHAQHSQVANHSIILDVDAATVARGCWQLLLERPYTAIGPGARKLIEYLGVMAQQEALTPAIVTGWTPLLLDTLLVGEPQPRSRLGALHCPCASRAWLALVDGVDGALRQPQCQPPARAVPRGNGCQSTCLAVAAAHGARLRTACRQRRQPSRDRAGGRLFRAKRADAGHARQHGCHACRLPARMSRETVNKAVAGAKNGRGRLATISFSGD